MLKTVSARFARLIAVSLFAMTSLATNAGIQAGKDYNVIATPVPVQTGKQIEVLEIFYYGCPHCFQLEPDINAWAKKLPKDVAFRRMAGVLPDSWIPLAKAFYAAEAMGATEKLHGEMFNAIHLHQVNLNDPQELFNLVGKQGVDAKKFADAYNSFAVQNKAMRAKQMTRAYGSTGVPMVVVDGKYSTSPSQAGSNQALLAIVDELVKKARQERAAKR